MVLTDDQLRNFDDPKFLLGGFNLGFSKSSDVLLKVTVTLYPKTPYNTAPIVLTRSVNYNVGSTPIEF